MALACDAIGPLPSGAGMWRALVAPLTARADDGQVDNVACETCAPEVVVNPFAVPQPSDVVSDPSAASSVLAERESEPASGCNERYASAPSLEPIRPRRANPQLADNDEMPTAQSQKRETGAGRAR